MPLKLNSNKNNINLQKKTYCQTISRPPSFDTNHCQSVKPLGCYCASTECGKCTEKHNREKSPKTTPLCSHFTKASSTREFSGKGRMTVQFDLSARFSLFFFAKRQFVGLKIAFSVICSSRVKLLHRNGRGRYLFEFGMGVCDSFLFLLWHNRNVTPYSKEGLFYLLRCS